MPFNCFKYNNFYNISSKSYHTAAKQSAAFFDSSFNHIKQNSQLVETFAQGAKRYPNPHPVNSISANYVFFDYSSNVTSSNDDNNNNNSHSLRNPINVVLPYNQDSFILSVHKNDYLQVVKKLPLSQTMPSKGFAKLNSRFQKNHLHTKSGVQDHQQQQPQSSPEKDSAATSPTLVDSVPLEVDEDKPRYFEPVFESYQEQSDATFLKTQTDRINDAFKVGDFKTINSYYMALKRNNIVPSRDIFAKVLYSVTQRTIDESLDDQLSVLLNVYQDMISNRIKPNLEIYSIVINQLLESSIKASQLPDYSSNGGDFFKIAIDIFNASNCTHIQQFDSGLIDKILVGMNLYPGFINSSSLMKILESQQDYSRNHIYYSSMINYCKFTNDFKLAISLYEEFKQATSSNENLTQHQFIIYSCFISTLVQTNEISLATKFLDKLLTSIKNYDDYESKANMLLTSYLLTLSKQNPSKAIEIWAQFNRIDWIPEFSYDFYTNLLNDLSGDYETSLKLYNYMAALPQHQSNPNSYDMNTLLITPSKNNFALTGLLSAAIEMNDKSTVLKLLKDSFIKKIPFELGIYPTLFHYVDNEDLITRITNSHGLTMKNGNEFLTFLVSNVANFPLYEVSKTEFFKMLVNEYSVEKPVNYYGFYQVFNSIVQVNEKNMNMVELLSPLIIEMHDLNNYYQELDQTHASDFKKDLTEYFKSLINEIDTSNASSMATDAIKLLKDSVI